MTEHEQQDNTEQLEENSDAKYGDEDRVELDGPELAALSKKIDSIQKDAADEMAAYVEHCRTVKPYLRGLHKRSATDLDEKALVEEIGEQKFPVIHYILPRLLKAESYILRDLAEPEVTPDNNASFTLPPEHPYWELRAMLEQSGVVNNSLSDNELAARLLTARLKRVYESDRFQDLLEQTILVAGLERLCLVKVDYEAEEGAKEGIAYSIMRPGDFLLDMDAPSKDESRFLAIAERGFTVEQIAEQYEISIDEVKTIVAGDDYRNVQRDYDDSDSSTLPDELHHLTIWHWWIRNPETVKATVQTEEGEVQAVAPKYRGGWQYVCRLGKKILFNGSAPTTTGAPNVVAFDWFPLPRDQVGVSHFDVAQPANNAMDELLAAGLNTFKKVPGRQFVNKKSLKNADILKKNIPNGIYALDIEGAESLESVVKIVPGASPPAALRQYQDILARDTDDLTGTLGISPESLRADVSGDAIEGFAQSNDGVLWTVRRRFYRSLKQLYLLTLELLMKYEELPRTLRMTGTMGRDVYIDLATKILSFEGTEIEASFDIEVTPPDNLPRNPAKRAEYLKQTMVEFVAMAQQDPTLAQAWLEVANLPHSAKLWEILEKVQQQQQAAAANAAQPEDPMAAVEAEFIAKVRYRAAEAVSDSLEELAKNAARAGQMDTAMRIISTIPNMVLAAMQNQPDPVPPEAALPVDPAQAPMEQVEPAPEELGVIA